MCVSRSARWPLRLRQQDCEGAELRAIAQGFNVTSDEDHAGDAAKRPIALAVAEFLEEVQITKDPKTYRGYDVALSYFRESCPKVHLESIDRKDLLKFTAFLKKEKKQSPRSVHNKFACLLTFLAANGLPKLSLRRATAPSSSNRKSKSMSMAN